ncbi:phage tail protein [Pantoea sp. 18069]|uniref:phage tail protein n=1 Tax=Pantoea sp. 18069 TaxID=2681415 RepID=UPI001358B6E7|nr:DUF1983 domain-containing protein [Pantoea sp. 18069]
MPGIESGAWTVMIGGAMVPRAMWKRTWPKHGQLIACRASVGKQVVQLVAMAALTWFTMGAGLALWAGTGAMASVIGMGTFVAGSMLINKVLGPKVPKMGEAAAARQVHSLSSRRNTKRPHEPLPTLWGEMRVLPDLASDSYTWFEGENQYLSTILLGGINVHSVSDLAIGDTPITSFEEVSAFFNGFSGMPSQDVPLYGNVDSIAGGELENDGAWVTRTSSTDTMTLQLDIEGQLYDVDNKANVLVNSVPLFVETRVVGSEAWQPALSTTLTNATRDVVRRTYTVSVALGQHEVRVRLGKPTYNEGDGKDACNFTWNVLKSIQPDTTDYSQWGRIGIKIKATGQISGSLDTLRATYRARPLPVWNGTEWITATTRAEGLSNCGAILLQTLRGVYAPDENGVPRLQFGFGMSDEQIDIEGLKAFMLHCTARGYNYDRWITGSMSLGQFCDEVALAGMGEFSWTDGSRPTAVFVSSGQPLSGVVNMANMLKGSFSVAYNLANAADGIEYQYLDRDRNWETQTLRVAAPGVTTMLSPARITSEGVTSEAHAAVLARYHLAQSLYQYKTIDFGADIEHLAYRRLSVLSVSHDLTQWGFGGRVMHAERVGGKVVLQLDEPVPPMPQAYVGLRVPGARDYRVFQVEALEAESEWVTLVGAWPAGVKFPGADLDNPAHDTLWCYDFKATPGYRVRVVGMQPEADLKGAQVTCVPEGPEFWDYVLNGTYTPAPNQSSLPQLGRPKVSNLRITEKVNVQGDTEWYSLGLVWDVEGDYDHAQVWAGRDGSELRMVDGNAVGSRAEFRIDGAGEWLVEVRPFNASGLVGQSATVLYITSMTQLPPRNVDDFVVQSVAGGLRRFAWQYVGDRPPAFAGVQIRYAPGDVQLSVADWDEMQPLGEAGDVYRAQFETTRPQAGLWTFGCRAIDTAGQLANGVVRFAANLGDSFEQVQQPDLTPPPAVVGLKAEGAFSTVMVSWDTPIYTQGHGHARTEVWAGKTADQAQASQMAESYGGPVSFSAEIAAAWYVWARNVTADGVSGAFVGPVTAETGADIEGLREVLDGQIDRDLFAPIVLDRLDMIDRIDQDGGPLGKSLLDAAVHQDALNQQVRGNMDDMAKGLLEAALAADAALERITDAGVYVDPTTGQVKIYGLDVTNGQVTNLQVLLDALNGQLQLKATTAYVDGKIAEAVLSPADLLLYEGLDARMIEVVQQLDSINGTLSSKASALELQQALVRLTTAEANLDALNGQIALRVTRAEYEADQGGIQERLGSAELTLSVLDVPAITATVTAVNRNEREAQKTAEALLRDILTGEANRIQAADALGFARTQLSAAIQEGLAAEAQQRLELAVVVGAQTSALEREESVRAQADLAEALARLQLAARVDSNQQSLSAQITQESQTRATAISAEAAQRQQLAATVSGNQTAALGAAQAASDAAGAKGKVLYQNAAPAAADRLPQNLWIDTTGGANTPKRWNGTAWVAVTDKVATDAVAAAAAAAQSAAEAKAQITQESQTRATAISAEAAQRQQLAATVSGNQTAALGAAQAASDAAGAKGKVLYQNAAPAAADRLPQNLWIDTTGGANTPKRWNGTAWVAVTDKVATDAVAAAAAAQQTATAATAAVEQEAIVRANADGHLGALYTVRMQLSQGGRQVVGGFAISGTSSATAGPLIDFGVMANSFWIAAPNGSAASSVKPFMVQTTAQTINGVVVPAGVYMDAVYINNVTALWGRFGSLVADTIQATAISASQLTAGNGVIGGTLKSANYVAGSSGWTLRPDGVAEFSGVIVRGTIYATAGVIGGITVRGDTLTTGAFTGWGWPGGTGGGMAIGPNGILLGNPNTGRYFLVQSDGRIEMPGFTVINGNATFSGNLSGASGSFSGVLTASKVVTTGNIADSAVTVPLFIESANGDGVSATVSVDSPAAILITVSYSLGNTDLGILRRNGATIRSLGATWNNQTRNPITLIVNASAGSHTFDIVRHPLRAPDSSDPLENPRALSWTIIACKK